jgi:hypothetical protein
LSFEETKRGIEHERQPKPDSRPSAIVVRKQRSSNESADADSNEHRPEPSRHGNQPAADDLLQEAATLSAMLLGLALGDVEPVPGGIFMVIVPS